MANFRRLLELTENSGLSEKNQSCDEMAINNFT